MSRVFSMATNPIHQDFVATGSEDETIRLWRVKPDCSGITACHAISPKPDPWMKVTWSDNGKLLAGGCSDGTACVSKFLPEGFVDEELPPGSAAVGTPCLQPIISLDLHPEEVYGCEFIAGRQDRLVTASSDSIFLWDLETEKILHFAQGGKVPQAAAVPVPDRWQPGFVFSVAVPPLDGIAPPNLIAGSCSDGVVRLWGRDGNASTVRSLVALPAHSKMSTNCKFTRDGSALVSVSMDGSLTVIDVRKLRVLDHVRLGQGALMGLDAAPETLLGRRTTPSTMLVASTEGLVYSIDPLRRPKDRSELAEGEEPQPADSDWFFASDQAVIPLSVGCPPIYDEDLFQAFEAAGAVPRFMNRVMLCCTAAMNGEIVLAGGEGYRPPKPPAPQRKARTRTTVAKGGAGKEKMLMDFNAAATRRGGTTVRAGKMECVDPNCIDPGCGPEEGAPAPVCVDPACADPSCGALPPKCSDPACADPNCGPSDAPPSIRFKGMESPLMAWNARPRTTMSLAANQA